MIVHFNAVLKIEANALAVIVVSAPEEIEVFAEMLVAIEVIVAKHVKAVVRIGRSIIDALKIDVLKIDALKIDALKIDRAPANV